MLLPRARRPLAAALVAAVVAAACSESSSPEPDLLATVNVLRFQDSLPVGGTVPLEADARLRSGAPAAGAIVSWSTLDPQLATITGGLLLGVDSGDARVVVTATHGGRTLVDTAVARVRHVLPRIASIAVTGLRDTLAIGDTLTPAFEPRDPRGTPLPQAGIALTALDTARLRVGGGRQLAAVAAGPARLVVEATGGRAAYAETLRVVVVRVPSRLTLSPATVLDTLYVGGRAFGATARVSDDQNLEITPRPAIAWSSSDPAVATVDTGGVVRARAAGTAWIRGAVASRPSVAESVFVRTSTFVPLRDRPMLDIAAGSQDWDRCGIDAARELWCTEVSSGDLPRLHATGIPITQVHVGQNQVCGLAADSTMHCIGNNGGGAMGLGVTTGRYTTFQAGGAGRKWSRLFVGEHRAACAIQAADSVLYCWGHNDFGQVGRPRPLDDPRILPTEPALEVRAADVSLFTACAVTLAGALWCWGDYTPYDSLFTNNNLPREVAPAGSYVDVSVGTESLCGLAADGAAWCRGWTTEFATRHVPIRVQSPVPFVKLEGAWESFHCGLTADGAAWCWTALARSSYVAEARLPALRFTKIAVGQYSACGRTADGHSHCWYQRPVYPLESGSASLRVAPRRVHTLDH